MKGISLKSNKPNIVYIMADDLGYGDLGCYGAEKIQTPNIDRIASQGVKMTDAHSCSAVCTPSRYSVMTGKYCWRTWLKRWVIGGLGQPLIEPGETTLASLLKNQGYATAAIGKWHLGLEWHKEDGSPARKATTDDTLLEYNGLDIDYGKPVTGGPTELGFDYFFGIAGSLDMPPYCFIENDRIPKKPTKLKESFYPQQREGVESEDWDDYKVDTVFADKAQTFIEEHIAQNSDKPFFLYLTTSSPHRPCLPPKEFEGASQAGARGDMVALYDWIVGEIDKTLEKHNLTENTLICITSDNGARKRCYDGKDYGHKSCGQLRGQKADIWDGGHRIPFIARFPGLIAPASESDDLICLGDMLATVADITGVRLDKDKKLDSQTFLPSLKGDKNGREHVIHHSGGGMFAVRKGRWKLILGLGSGGFSEPVYETGGEGSPEGQLYDMEADLAETNNLWLEKPEIVAELTSLIEQAWRDS